MKERSFHGAKVSWKDRGKDMLSLSIWSRWNDQRLGGGGGGGGAGRSSMIIIMQDVVDKMQRHQTALQTRGGTSVGA